MTRLPITVPMAYEEQELKQIKYKSYQLVQWKQEKPIHTIPLFITDQYLKQKTNVVRRKVVRTKAVAPSVYFFKRRNKIDSFCLQSFTPGITFIKLFPLYSCQ
jgi:hypothetical protein